MTEMDRKHDKGDSGGDVRAAGDLAEFFDAARGAPEVASDGLMARVLDDAIAVQAETAAAARATRAMHDRPDTRRPGLFAGLFAALGGWPAMAGLGTAAAVGLWIGFTPALGLGDAVNTALSGQATDGYLVDYATGYDLALQEGDAG